MFALVVSCPDILLKGLKVLAMFIEPCSLLRQNQGTQTWAWQPARFNQTIIEALSHSIIQWFNHSGTQPSKHWHSVTESLNNSSTRSLWHPTTQPINESNMQWINERIKHSFMHSFIHSFVWSFRMSRFFRLVVCVRRELLAKIFPPSLCSPGRAGRPSPTGRAALARLAAGWVGKPATNKVGTLAKF